MMPPGILSEAAGLPSSHHNNTASSPSMPNTVTSTPAPSKKLFAFHSSCAVTGRRHHGLGSTEGISIAGVYLHVAGAEACPSGLPGLSTAQGEMQREQRWRSLRQLRPGQSHLRGQRAEETHVGLPGTSRKSVARKQLSYDRKLMPGRTSHPQLRSTDITSSAGSTSSSGAGGGFQSSIARSEPLIMTPTSASTPLGAQAVNTFMHLGSIGDETDRETATDAGPSTMMDLDSGARARGPDDYAIESLASSIMEDTSERTTETFYVGEFEQ